MSPKNIKTLLVISILTTLLKTNIIEEHCKTVTEFENQYRDNMEQTLSQIIAENEFYKQEEGISYYSINHGFQFKILKYFKNSLIPKKIEDEFSVYSLLAPMGYYQFLCAYEKDFNDYEVFIIEEENLESNLGKVNYGEQEKLQIYKSIYQMLRNIHSVNVAHNNLSPTSILLRNGRIVFDNYQFGGKSKEPLKPKTHTCYDFPNHSKTDFHDVYVLERDLYSVAVTIAVLESDYDTICKKFDDHECSNLEENPEKNQKCFVQLRTRIEEVMGKKYDLSKKDTKNCQNIGCIVMNSLKNYTNDLPQEKHITAALKKIKKRRILKAEEYLVV